jgi:hypothetical protein
MKIKLKRKITLTNKKIKIISIELKKNHIIYLN